MGDWYSIGLAAGLGVGLGVIVATVTGIARASLFAAAAIGVAAAAGFGAGLVVEDSEEAFAGLAGGVLGALAAVVVVRGALRRGGTAGGTAALVALGGLVLAALAFIPILGYLEALAAPALAARLARRGGDRYAGLRILARD